MIIMFSRIMSIITFFIANRLFPMKREKDWLMRMDMIKKTVIITRELVDNEED